jgi:hypothetical protein
MRALLRACEVVMAAVVPLTAAIMFTGLPQPYSTWPTVGPVPGLLGVVTIRDSTGWCYCEFGNTWNTWRGDSVAVSNESPRALYAFGWWRFLRRFFTLISGIALSVAVVVRASILRGRSTEFNFLD